tara:strand:- start:276 stop:530 length:255 start_codon:yes stop_codon:yes gene_type:complete
MLDLELEARMANKSHIDENAVSLDQSTISDRTALMKFECWSVSQGDLFSRYLEFMRDCPQRFTVGLLRQNASEAGATISLVVPY